MRACGLIAAVVAGVSPDQSGVAGREGALHAATPLIRTVAVGGYPTTIAVDQQTARVFVPNTREGTDGNAYAVAAPRPSPL
jgi:DNA-binding beta-propeller fold protein YncE